jgi:hypothetical protein
MKVAYPFRAMVSRKMRAAVSAAAFAIASEFSCTEIFIVAPLTHSI